MMAILAKVLISRMYWYWKKYKDSVMEKFSELIRSDKPVLVDFYADWCGPCKSMEPVIKEVAKSVTGKTRVIKVNIDRNQQTARDFNVSAVPTFILFKNGNVLWRHPGMIDKAGLLSVLHQYS
jgi:thioredoxin 1